MSGLVYDERRCNLALTSSVVYTMCPYILKQGSLASPIQLRTVSVYRDFRIISFHQHRMIVRRVKDIDRVAKSTGDDISPGAQLQ